MNRMNILQFSGSGVQFSTPAAMKTATDSPEQTLKSFSFTNCSKTQCARHMPYVKRHSFTCIFKENTVQCVNGQRKQILVHFTHSVLCEPR